MNSKRFAGAWAVLGMVSAGRGPAAEGPVLAVLGAMRQQLGQTNTQTAEPCRCKPVGQPMAGGHHRRPVAIGFAIEKRAAGASCICAGSTFCQKIEISGTSGTSSTEPAFNCPVRLRVVRFPEGRPRCAFALPLQPLKNAQGAACICHRRQSSQQREKKSDKSKEKTRCCHRPRGF